MNPRLTTTLILLSTLLVRAEGQTLVFTDQTVAAGVENLYTPGSFSFPTYTGGGVCGDFDGDGWQDIFIPSDGAGGSLDRLFMNNGDGTFTDEAAAWGMTIAHMGKGASVGDFNNDGHLDIYCTSAGPYNSSAPGHHKLWRNNGNRSFTNVALSAGVAFTTAGGQDGFGSCFGDYDLDGDLDLFVSGTASNNAGSILFRNNGNESFTNVTIAAGLMVGLPFTMFGFAPRMVDMDGDFHPELLLVSDFGTSVYYRNNGDGTFSDWSWSSGTGLEENGMGQTVGDFDNDGLLDWYVTSIYQPSIGWTGNKLYMNQGNHVYSEISAAAGVFNGGYGWAAIACDFDHDGWVDIAETNGGSSTFQNEQSYLWLNNGDGTFSETAIASGLVHTVLGRGMLNLDYDNDGDQDVMILSLNDPNVLYRNDLSGPDRNWLRVFLDNNGSSAVAPHGMGSRVVINFGAESRTCHVHGGDNFLSMGELSAHFGLGAVPLIDTLTVHWPDGTTDQLTGVAVNQTITVTYEGATFMRGDANGDGAFDLGDPIAVLAYLFQGAGTLACESAADINGDGTINISDPIYSLAYAFGGGAPPPAPFPACAAEPSPVDCDQRC
ncbi:MAG: FG-GAP-like repeat-containing protein [Planctomycetota bacterium]